MFLGLDNAEFVEKLPRIMEQTTTCGLGIRKAKEIIDEDVDDNMDGALQVSTLVSAIIKLLLNLYRGDQ